MSVPAVYPHEYIEELKFSRIKHLLVEGESDADAFRTLLDDLYEGNEIEIDTADRIKSVITATDTDNPSQSRKS